MATLQKRVYTPTGRTTWLVTFRKRIYGKDRVVEKDHTLSKSFLSEEEAERFIEEEEDNFRKSCENKD